MAAGTAIVLVGTKGGLNLGASARAMANFGFERLLLVRPEAELLGDHARAMAIEALPILEKSEIFETLADAVEGCRYVFATTRRVGRKRRAEMSPRDMARLIIGMDPGEGAAIVFGPEDKGLCNEDLRVCNGIVTLHTGAVFDSLNLAQAVLLMLYEIHRTYHETPAQEAADLERVEKLITHVEMLLRDIGFIEGIDPDQVITRLRKLLLRAGPTFRESGLLHAIIARLAACAWRMPGRGRRRGTPFQPCSEVRR